MDGMTLVCLLYQDLDSRGYTADAIRKFCSEIGVSKADSKVDSQMLDFFVREDLQAKAPLAMGILNPLKVSYN